tara:strand:- start:4214 stop:4966 length:753 start_codon:yes stop_codon:yes gene_type:complete
MGQSQWMTPEIKKRLDSYASQTVKKTTPMNLAVIIQNDPHFRVGSDLEIRPLGLLSPDCRERGPYKCDIAFPQRNIYEVSTMGLDEGSANLLSGLVTSLRPRVVFETGTHLGRSTKALASALLENENGVVTTVDMFDYGLMTSGALSKEEREYVIQVVGECPQVLQSEELSSLQGIEFAFLDGDHTAEGVARELAFVDERRADKCWVAVDNARDPGWPELEKFFKGYNDYPHVNLETMSGMELIQMEGAR